LLGRFWGSWLRRIWRRDIEVLLKRVRGAGAGLMMDD
jgi:hypothetical protein